MCNVRDTVLRESGRNIFINNLISADAGMEENYENQEDIVSYPRNGNDADARCMWGFIRKRQ